jgi:Tol biopolymer transport system component
MPLTALNSPGNDEAGALRDDGLEIIFASDRVGGFTLYSATRADRSQPFGAPVALTQLATGQDNNDPYLSHDALTMYFNTADVYITTRPDLSSPWSAPQLVPQFNMGGAFDGALGMTKDELTAYFSSDRSGTAGLQDLFRATRPTLGAAFGTPAILAAASSVSYDCCPAVSADDAHVMFTTQRTGDFEVFTSDIIAGGDLASPVSMTVINTTFNELDPFTTIDDRYLGFSSDRPGGQGNLDLYLMERSCP